MLFPISDDDSQITTTAYVTYFLLLANILVFIYQSQNPEFTYGWSVVPAEIVTGEDLTEPIRIEGPKPFLLPQSPGPRPIYLTLFSSMFMHAGFAHIFGNMLYLWIFGDNVEHRFGHGLFIVFYVVSGLIASLAQVAVNPQGVIPNLGASGAIWGVMGAYLVLFPRNKVNALIGYFFVTIPALWVIGMWAVLQLFLGFGSLVESAPATGGVAYMAHIGGLVSGVAMGLVARFLLDGEPDTVSKRQYQRDQNARRWW